MNLFKTPVKPVEENTPKPDLGKEVSYADSFLYSKYALKPYNPAELYQKYNNYTIYDQMRTDDQINSVLNLKKYITLNSDWYIECEDEEVASFLTSCLTEYLDRPIEKKLLEIMSALDYGFSITEKIPEYRMTDYGNKIVWKKFKTRAPHTFEIKTTDKGDVEKILQDTANQGEIEIPLSKVILYSYNKEFDNPYGNSEMTKGVYTAWWSKQAIIKFWNIYLEKFASPIGVGTIAKGSSKENKDAFQTIMNNLSARTGITVPEGFEIKLLHGAEGKAEFEKAIDKYNMMIARAFLLPDLMGLSGSETGGGSYSLGKEQFNMFYTVIANNRTDLKRIIDNEILKPLVVWNYGNNIKAEFKFNPIDEDRKQSDLTMWLEAVKAGKIPQNIEQINWFLESINAPEIDEKEWEEEQKKKEEMQKAISEDKTDDEDDKQPEDEEPKKPEPTKDKEVDEAKESDKDKDEKFAMSEPVVYWRSLTVYENKEDFKRMEKEEDELINKFLPECGDVFKLVINAMLNDIRQKKIIERKRLSEINKLQTKHLKKLEKVFTDINKQSYDTGKSSVNYIEKYAYDLQGGITPEEVAEWIKQSAIYGAITESEEIQKKIKGVLFDAIRSGSGTRETMKQLDEALKGWNYLPDAPKTLKASRLETIVRTNVAKSYNQARSDEFDKYSEIITGYFYSAILDGRTSDLCLSLDSGSAGIYKPSEKDLINPPNHYNCRSRLVPVFTDETIDKTATLPNVEQTNGGFLKLKKEDK